MDRDSFDKLFDAEIAQPLLEVGFVAVGKSLHLVKSHFHVALIRLGGRFSMPGSIASSLCFRHSFLRLVEAESNAEVFKLGVFDFPYKLTLKESRGWLWKLRYESRLLNYPYDRFDFSGLSERKVVTQLVSDRVFLLQKFLPVALAKLPRETRAEILRFGTDGWCEKRWIEDYDSHLESGGST